MKNVKTNALTRKFDDIFFNQNNERLKYQHQILFISDRLQINALKSNVSVSIHNRILNANKNDEICSQIRSAFDVEKKVYQRVSLI